MVKSRAILNPSSGSYKARSVLKRWSRSTSTLQHSSLDTKQTWTKYPHCYPNVPILPWEWVVPESHLPCACDWIGDAQRHWHTRRGAFRPERRRRRSSWRQECRADGRACIPPSDERRVQSVRRERSPNNRCSSWTGSRGASCRARTCGRRTSPADASRNAESRPAPLDVPARS